MNPATLTLLIERARTKVDAAQLRLASLQKLVEQAQAHLDVLRRYHGEYEERSACRPGDLHDPGARQNEMRFLARLQQAIETQMRELEIRRETAAAAAAELAQARRKEKSLQTLLQRRLESERLAQSRRDQKNTDEFAQRAHDRTVRARMQQDAIDAREVP
jgi:flagellar FliJ protein